MKRREVSAKKEGKKTWTRVEIHYFQGGGLHRCNCCEKRTFSVVSGADTLDECVQNLGLAKRPDKFVSNWGNLYFHLIRRYGIAFQIII